jgi:hypothetical protein
MLSAAVQKFDRKLVSHSDLLVLAVTISTTAVLTATAVLKFMKYCC